MQRLTHEQANHTEGTFANIRTIKPKLNYYMQG